MRDYRFCQLSDDHFEYVISQVCRVILGIGTVSFTKGRDGGRDGSFEGVAQHYPSNKEPWKGKFILQAKHTSSPVASCSDNDFFANKSSLVNKEIPKIKSLRENGEVDNYLLFTNRKLSGDAHEKIRAHISASTGIPNVAIIGVDTLSGWLDGAPELVKVCQLDHLVGVLRFHPEELKEIIEAFYSQHVIDRVKAKTTPSFDYLELTRKNELNRLSERVFTMIKNTSEFYFNEVDKFLENPVNDTLREQYDNIADEFNNKIIIRRDQFGAFEEVFELLYNQIVETIPKLREKRRLINVFLHYMYFNCDIGEKNADTN